MDYFGYDESDFIPSELSGERAVDINHIECKGMGGNPSKDKDVIENLMAMTRDEHVLYGDKTQYKPMLQAIHEHFMATREPYFLSRDCKKLSKEVSELKKV